MAIPKSSGSLYGFISEQVVVTCLGKRLLQMSFSIMTIRSKEQIKTPSIKFFHRLVMLVPVSDALIKSPTVCNVASRNACFRIDYNLV